MTVLTILLDKPVRSSTTLKLSASPGLSVPASLNFPAGITGRTVDASPVLLDPPHKVDVDITVGDRTFKKVLTCNMFRTVTGPLSNDRGGFFGSGFGKGK